ncbi:alpha/beta-hydrolase [Aulographum hederae CBS 113979]|uniref:Alpha/beta-hydrolase n=1 Tax=Aulographum hederae CBS 113979 TaxID=1176131 RepID=A0A6G1GX03_9PEZI|nr:alpha/beta-hydrolase [Aulographum hederae CBS 113979]
MLSIVVFLYVLSMVGGSLVAAGVVSNLETRADMPVLDFPSGRVRARTWDPTEDVFCFKNIRFAAPPTGALRFAKPAQPARDNGISDGSFGPACAGTNNGKTTGEEDCLFLDLYVPGKQLRNGATAVPVLNWVYGGGYITGSKDEMSGLSLIRASGGNLIFVSANYRLGAFGWMAGSSMEAGGQPNAALFDQRTVLQWIQDNIHIVNGDKTAVTVMGQSAGAGSLVHHLTAFGGKQDPLFHQAILQSPAYQPQYDRGGNLEQRFQNFSTAAGCSGQGLDCLRRASFQSVADANNQIIGSAIPGTFGFGPAADGAWVRQLPLLEFASGNYWKKMNKILITHVSNEVSIFVPQSVRTDGDFETWAPQVFPQWDNQPTRLTLDRFQSSETEVADAIFREYPRTDAPNTPYRNVTSRVSTFIRDTSFTCNVRYVADAYIGSIYAGLYSRGTGYHGVDLIADFLYTGNWLLDEVASIGSWLNPGELGPGFTQFTRDYQSYLASFAGHGDPNTGATGAAQQTQWDMVVPGDEYGDVLHAGDDGFGPIDDSMTAKPNCAFWTNGFAALTNLGGRWKARNCVLKVLELTRDRLRTSWSNRLVEHSPRSDLR